MKQITKRKSKSKHLVEIFSNHIGEQNGITFSDLFVEVYGVFPEELQFYERHFKNQYLECALNYLRRKSKVFIVSKNSKLFVVTSREEAESYIQKMKNLKMKADYMIKRCNQAIEERWFEELKR